jgi:hypothetical protein
MSTQGRASCYLHATITKYAFFIIIWNSPRLEGASGSPGRARHEALDPAEVKLPNEPAEAVEELGKPLTGLECKTCGYITTSREQMCMHCKKDHQQAWKGDSSQLYSTIKGHSVPGDRSTLNLVVHWLYRGSR